MTERYTPAHVCACVGAWVRVRARVGTCVCACAWVRGFVSRFFARGCVRVGACVCACARVGGVGCKAAGTLARWQARWICTIHHEHKGISCFPPHNPRVIPSPQPNGCFPSPGWLVGWLPLLWLSLYWLPCCWVTGNRLLLVVFLWGVGVEGGGVFWVGVLFGAVG
jgi:hypothetical protein